MQLGQSENDNDNETQNNENDEIEKCEACGKTDDSGDWFH